MTKDDASNSFIKYWQLIAVLMTMAVGYGSMQSSINAMAQDIQEQKTETKEAGGDRQSVRLTVVAIEKDVEHIKENLKDQDEKLDLILEKLSEK